MFRRPRRAQRGLEIADELLHQTLATGKRLGRACDFVAPWAAHHRPAPCLRGFAQRRVIQHAVGAALHVIRRVRFLRGRRQTLEGRYANRDRLDATLHAEVGRELAKRPRRAGGDRSFHLA